MYCSPVLRISMEMGGSLGSNPDISQRYKMGNISKEEANTLKPAKKYKNSIKDPSFSGYPDPLPNL
jgi:hypothetical protein